MEGKAAGGKPSAPLATTDIVLPGLDGFALAERALRQRPDLRILYTTGYNNDAAAERMRAASVLQKPVELGQLARRARDALDGAPAA